MAALKARVDTAVSYGAVFVPCPKPILQEGTEQLVVYPGFAAPPPSPFLPPTHPAHNHHHHLPPTPPTLRPYDIYAYSPASQASPLATWRFTDT